MINNEALATYYEKIRPFCQTHLKEFFSRIPSSDLQNIMKSKKIISQQRSQLDEMFLMEACVFLRHSVSNLLAYKDLMCSNYLAWATTTRYYSIFYAVNGLLRLIGKATIHPSTSDKDMPFQWIGKATSHPSTSDGILSFQLTRNKEMHSYTIETAKGNEHKRLFTNFSQKFPALMTQEASAYIRRERVNWNYDPFFMSQDMSSYALDETKIYCEYNFIDENLGNISTPEFAEDYEKTRITYGYGEVFAWELIKYGLGILKSLEKRSEFTNDYNDFWDSLIKSINEVRSKEETKITIKSFIESLQKQ